MDLGKDTLLSLSVKLSIPAILAQMANLIYSICNRIFIGQLPDSSLAQVGLGITLPITMIISSLGVLFGAGGALLAAIALGENNKEKAEKILGTSFAMLTVTSIMLQYYLQPLTNLFYTFSVPAVKQLAMPAII